MLLRCLFLIFGLMVSAVPAVAQTPASPGAGPVYSLTFFETGVSQAGKGAGLFRQYAAATRKAEGVLGVVALQETARSSRFALIEAWRDKAAAEAHASALGALRNDMQPFLAAPFDTRSNIGLDIAGGPIGSEPDGSRAIYVLTHVDVFPAGKDQTIDMLKQLAAASRKENGNLRFDVLQQDGRANHLPLVEAWRDAQAQSTHAMAEHTRAFRAKLVTLQGALYDERLYRSIR